MSKACRRACDRFRRRYSLAHEQSTNHAFLPVYSIFFRVVVSLRSFVLLSAKTIASACQGMQRIHETRLSSLTIFGVVEVGTSASGLPADSRICKASRSPGDLAFARSRATSGRVIPGGIHRPNDGAYLFLSSSLEVLEFTGPSSKPPAALSPGCPRCGVIPLGFVISTLGIGS